MGRDTVILQAVPTRRFPDYWRKAVTPQISRVKRLAEGLPKRYAFRSLIGRGSAAYVVLADDLEGHTQVAVKILRPDTSTRVGENRFRREIEILRQLDHPNILPLLDHGSTVQGSLFLVTPFVDGETLRTRLLRDKRLEVVDAIAIAGGVASALDEAHRRGLIHRDIKPSNVLLSGRRVIVADFGISRAMVIEQNKPITISGATLGTPEYMSPEQIGGEMELDARCDIYAMGCVVYEMLVGKPPFTGSLAKVFTSQRNEAPRPIGEVRPAIPAGVDAAVMKSLAKQRGSRFETAGEFARALIAAEG
jgi:serine/threonine protein kinase